MIDLLPQVRELMSVGLKEAGIATRLGITRQRARGLVAEAERAGLPAVVAEIEPQTVEEFAERIHASWRKSRESLIEVGRLLCRAKVSLPHGEFQRLIDDALPFKIRTAEMLMAINRDEKLTNPQYVAHLPDAITTLYELRELDTETFTKAINSGKIHPDMERKEVYALKNGVPVNGARSVMASRADRDDESLDYFPTPLWGTRALMEYALMRDLNGGDAHDPPPSLSAWEPACGEGHMSAVLAEYFAQVIASDIFDYSGGDQSRWAPNWWRTLDFLDPQAGDGTPVVDWIITNPPFKDDLSERFILRALDLARTGVAMFVRVQLLEGVGRYERLWKDKAPSLIAFFAERVPLHRGRWEPDGSTATAYCWLVWRRDSNGESWDHDTRVMWIPPGCRERLSKVEDRERFAR